MTPTRPPYSPAAFCWLSSRGHGLHRRRSNASNFGQNLVSFIREGKGMVNVRGDPCKGVGCDINTLDKRNVLVTSLTLLPVRRACTDLIGCAQDVGRKHEKHRDEGEVRETQVQIEADVLSWMDLWSIEHMPEEKEGDPYQTSCPVRASRRSRCQCPSPRTNKVGHIY